MYKDGILTIKDWDKGMESHPIYGFGMLKNVEVFENRGLVKLKNRSIDRDALVSTPTGAVPIAEVYDVYGNIYTLTGIDGTYGLFKNGSSITTLTGQGWDLAYYKDYVWIRHGSRLSAYGPVNNSPAFFANLSTGFNGNYYGKLIVGQDSFLYSTNGNAIAKIEVTASGTPSVAPTLTITLDALDLPDGQYADCIAEYGTNLMIGTHGGASYGERANYATARIYPWNRLAGTLGNPGLADLPVIFNENGVNAMINHANILYISAGDRGNIYRTDGTNYQKIAQLPYSKLSSNNKATVLPNAMAISSRGTLLVGLSGEENDASAMGMYEIDINNSGYPVSRFTTYPIGGTPVTIGFVNQKDYQTLYVGGQVLTTPFVYYTDTGLYGGGVSTPSIESPLYKLGNYHRKKTFSQLEFQLAETLVDGQSISFYYRKNTNDDYTLIGTFDFDDLGAVSSYELPAPIADCEYLQIKIEMSQEGSFLATNNMYLIAVMLR